MFHDIFILKTFTSLYDEREEFILGIYFSKLNLVVPVFALIEIFITHSSVPGKSVKPILGEINIKVIKRSIIGKIIERNLVQKLLINFDKILKYHF